MSNVLDDSEDGLKNEEDNDDNEEDEEKEEEEERYSCRTSWKIEE